MLTTLILATVLTQTPEGKAKQEADRLALQSILNDLLPAARPEVLGAARKVFADVPAETQKEVFKEKVLSDSEVISLARKLPRDEEDAWIDGEEAKRDATIAKKYGISGEQFKSIFLIGLYDRWSVPYSPWCSAERYHKALAKEAVAKEAAARLGFPEARVYWHNLKIGMAYDRFENNSTFEANLGRVLTDKSKELSLDFDLDFFFKGKEREAVPLGGEVSFNLRGRSRTWEWLKYREFSVIADGERYAFKEPEHHGDVKTGYVTESIWVNVPVRKLLRMAKARKIECKLGVEEFDLTTDQVNCLKDFAARLGLDSKTADKLADEKAEKIAQVREAWQSALLKAEDAQKKYPKRLVTQRDKAFGRALEVERVRVEKDFGLTNEELVAILRERDDE